MATEIQERVDQRVQLINQAREFLAECEKDHGGLTEEETARFDAMHDDADKLKAEIDDLAEKEQAAVARAERQQQAEDDLKELQNRSDFDKIRHRGSSQPDTHEPVNRLAAVDDVVQAWANGGRSAIQNDSQRQQLFNVSGCEWDTKAGGLYIPLNNQAPKNLWQYQNAQSIGTTTAGGHITFPGFVSSLEQALLQFGGMRQASSIMRTATGSAIDWPTVNDTSNSGALLAENTQDAEQDITFGNVTLDAYKYTSKIVRVSVELMQDAAFNLGTVLGAALGERLGRIQNTHATTGTGSGQPNGVVTAATLGTTAASATAITIDELLDLEASVDPAYRPNATWMFNDATRNHIRKLKDGNSAYHWQPSVQAGTPDMLLNKPFIVNQDIADIATTEKTVLFGDFSKYQIREVLGVTLVQLSERYADYHQVAFVALMRFDSDLLDAGTNPIKYLQQA